jgi:hypothetical protein
MYWVDDPICTIHLANKQPTSHLHNLYMKKRVITSGDNRLYGGLGEWGNFSFSALKIAGARWMGILLLPSLLIPLFCYESNAKLKARLFRISKALFYYSILLEGR